MKNRSVATTLCALFLLVLIFFANAVVTADAQTVYYWPVMGHTGLSQGYHAGHNAIDISDSSINGAPVCAVIGGTVYIRYNCGQQHYGSSHTCDGFGTGMIIRGDDGRYYTYAHMQYGSIPAAYTRGAYIAAGATIGAVGTTGNSSGPHLHFCISGTSYAWGGDVNPLTLTYQYSLGAPVRIEYTNFSWDVYYIKNVANGEYLSVSYGADAKGQNVNTWAFNGYAEEQMELIPYGSGYKIHPLCSGSRVINPNGYTVAPGQNVDIWDDTNDGTQLWGFQKVSGGYVIRSMQNQNCVIAVGADNRNVVTESYTGNSNQIWTIVPKNCTHPVYSSAVTQAATCTNTGTETYTCTTCGATKTQSIAATGHAYANATCTMPKKCFVCGTTSGFALGHSYDSGHVTKAATCQEDGIKTYTCTVCYGTKTEEIPKLIRGDLDSNGAVNEDDVIYLLQHLLMPGEFSVNQGVDYDQNKTVDENDVIYLLQHLLMPQEFPLT